MMWYLSHRADQLTRHVADRHYNRQKPGTRQFVPPGRCMVLYAERVTPPQGKAFWVTSWPFPEFVKHEWAGAWVCSAFRNEGCGTASVMIREAIAATRYKWPEIPYLGMITFIDRSKVKPTIVRSQKVWGWTYRKAGFHECGETKGGLLCLRLLPDEMPEPKAPRPPAFSAEGMAYWMPKKAIV